MELDRIVITGARQHNLKNVTVEVPKKKLVVLTGVSGSGKSSLAFDALYAEGQRSYIESLSAYARQFLGQMDKPLYDSIKGLAPTISIEQKSRPADRALPKFLLDVLGGVASVTPSDACSSTASRGLSSSSGRPESGPPTPFARQCPGTSFCSPLRSRL
jgi:hypothetical protein